MPLLVHNCVVHLADILPVAGLAAAVLATIAGLYATRRWGTRRRRLSFVYQSASLMPEGPRAWGALRLVYGDLELQDPYLVTLHLRNVGSNDIASQHFDGGRPLVIELGCTIYGLTNATHPDMGQSAIGDKHGVITLPPRLLRKGEEWLVEAIVEGVPSPRLINSLIDTDLVKTSEPSRIVRAAIQRLRSHVAIDVGLPIVEIQEPRLQARNRRFPPFAR